MLDFLATLWCLIGIIVGIMVLFLAVVGVFAMIATAAQQHEMKKFWRK